MPLISLAKYVFLDHLLPSSHYFSHLGQEREKGVIYSKTDNLPAVTKTISCRVAAHPQPTLTRGGLRGRVSIPAEGYGDTEENCESRWQVLEKVIEEALVSALNGLQAK